MSVARLIIDSPAAGSWNMAVDEALLISASQHQRMTLRLYRWQEPTVSLGYFQSYAQRHSHQASAACPLVRRGTGGGAIIHDRELTYSLTAPVPDRVKEHATRWYDAVHQAWRRALATCQAEARICPATNRDREQQFLCFQRRAAGDLLLASQKVGGSAQRRHRQAVLQHGSLLLERSTAAPELQGIRELAGQPLPVERFIQQWLEELSTPLGVQWQPASLEAAEQELAKSLVREKYAAKKWTLRR